MFWVFNLCDQKVTHIFVTKRLQMMKRDAFQAISDPVRREIMDLLTQQSLTVNEIAERFPISRPAISKHLKILRECGLLRVEAKGRERICHLEATELIPAFLWIERYQKLWENRIDSFEQYLSTLKNKQNGNDE